MDIIAHESATDIFRVEVDTILELISCQTNVGENQSDFASRYTGGVAKFVNLTSPMDTVMERQFSVLLLRNANIPPDLMKARMYELTVTASITYSYAYSDKTQYVINLTEEEAKNIMNLNTNDTRNE